MKLNNQVSKKVLFIGTPFFGYEKKIKMCLGEEFNFIVTYFPDCPRNICTRLLRNFHYKVYLAYIKKYHKYIISKIRNHQFDFLFVIRGQDLDIDFLESVSRQIEGKKILYEWDSVSNFDYTKFASLFDYIYTFDRMDSIHYNYKYLPLFYVEPDTVMNRNKVKKYDISFVGSYHGDRDIIIEKILYLAKKMKLSYKFHLYIPFLSYIKYLLKGHRIRVPCFFKLSYSKTMELIRSSRIVLDLPHENQTGSTMRTFECLGNDKFLLTTNSNIINEDFYYKKRIKIIDKNNLTKNDLIFEDSNEKIDFSKYSLSSWLKQIFNGKSL